MGKESGGGKGARAGVCGLGGETNQQPSRHKSHKKEYSASVAGGHRRDRRGRGGRRGTLAPRDRGLRLASDRRREPWRADLRKCLRGQRGVGDLRGSAEGAEPFSEQ
jgi:hypothetical protein